MSIVWSIQSYVPALHALAPFKPVKVVVSTYQAISGAGKSFAEWPELLDNVIPCIEKEKNEQEPLRIWGRVANGEIVKADHSVISAQCVRVPVTDGHLATAPVKFEHNPTKEEILDCRRQYRGRPQELCAERPEALF